MINDPITVRTFQGTTELCNLVAFCYHATFELFCGPAGPDEDDGGSLCHQPVELEQRRELVVVLIDVDVQLLDALDCQVLVCQSQHVGLRREAIGV